MGGSSKSSVGYGMPNGPSAAFFAAARALPAADLPAAAAAAPAAAPAAEPAAFVAFALLRGFGFLPAAVCAGFGFDASSSSCVSTRFFAPSFLVMPSADTASAATGAAAAAFATASDPRQRVRWLPKPIPAVFWFERSSSSTADASSAFACSFAKGALVRLRRCRMRVGCSRTDSGSANRRVACPTTGTSSKGSPSSSSFPSCAAACSSASRMRRSARRFCLKRVWATRAFSTSADSENPMISSEITMSPTRMMAVTTWPNSDMPAQAMPAPR